MATYDPIDTMDALAPDPLRPMRAMIDAAPRDALVEFARALHGRLYAPADAAGRRVAELGFLSEQLALNPQVPGRLPRMLQEVYELERKFADVDAPSAEVLAWRYGSWKKACYAAYGLRPDGSKSERGTPWPTRLRGESSERACDAKECVASVKACAEAIGRIPTSSDYAKWWINRRARARERGQRTRVASPRQILKQLAPKRGHRDGWKIVRRKVFGNATI